MTSVADHTTYIAGFPFFPRRPPVDPPPAWTTRPPTPTSAVLVKKGVTT